MIFFGKRSGITLFIFFLLFINLYAVQDNPILAPDIQTLPMFDGVGDDACWQNLPWQAIDQVWIDYGTDIPAEDFTGRYKIAWSSETNLLYFLIEVTDDAIVGGFIHGETAEIHNFDVVEVFIDEDDSGGLHLFDATGNDTSQYGSNAENAFAYHMFSEYLADDSVNTVVEAMELDGSAWWPQGNAWWADYASHVPDFAMRKHGNTVVREFSLIVYNDTFEVGNEASARVTLQPEKLMGLSVAYCDNDGVDETPKVRDHFFGSVWVPAEAYNDHYLNADGFGNVRLVEEIETSVHVAPPVHYDIAPVYPNPAGLTTTFSMHNNFRGNVNIALYNVLGQQVFTSRQIKTGPNYTHQLPLQNLTPGIYFVQARWNGNVHVQKLVVR